MCIIIDANVASKVFAVPYLPDYIPLWKWIQDRDGKIVCGGKLREELEKITHVNRLLKQLFRAGKALQPQLSDVDQKQKEVEKAGLCKSNDHHVIALALVSGARTLCTEDSNLEQDFKNPALISNPRGSIYKNADHAHLLKHTPGCIGRN